MNIELGAMAPSLMKQLQGTGLSGSDIITFNKDSDAITRLYVRGLLTERECEKARNRLIKRLGKALNKKFQI